MIRCKLFEFRISYTAFSLALFLLCFLSCTKHKQAEDGSKTGYDEMVRTLNECETKFYTAYCRVKDRETANDMQKCLDEVTAELEKLVATSEHLPALQMPDKFKYMKLLSDPAMDIISNNGILLAPGDPIAFELIEASEKYSTKRMQIISNFGFVLTPEEYEEYKTLEQEQEQEGNASDKNKVPGAKNGKRKGMQKKGDAAH